MYSILIKTEKIVTEKNTVIVANKLEEIKNYISNDEYMFVNSQFSNENSKTCFAFNKFNYFVFVVLFKTSNTSFKKREYYRKQGSTLYSLLKENEIRDFQIQNTDLSKQEIFDFSEGLLLSNYSFDKYKTKKSSLISDINLISTETSKDECDRLNLIADSVFRVRDWVNEPGSYLTPKKFTEEVLKLFSNSLNVKTTVYNSLQIKSLKMSGLVNVNKGSQNEPRFIVLDYEPKGIDKNKPAIIIIGKGIFFDTGGVNLKPSQGLQDMKCDMAGAATVASTIYLLSALNIKSRVIGLIPAAENRPGENAYLPGDILEMMNGVSVEIKNTDAEGRLILADALCYSKKYESDLIITIATLTGSASSTFGNLATAAMQNNAEQELEKLKHSSFNVYERIAELPMWEEYEKMIESKIADIQNVGGKYAGAITAAKFLQKFTDKPFIHLDIAGTAYFDNAESYIPAGGTGVGLRLLLDFIETK